MSRTGQLELEYGTQAALDRAGAEWVGRARYAVSTFAASGVVFTSDDIRARMEHDPPPNANAWGAVIRACANEGWIVEVGTTRSRRPDAHGRKVTRWRAAA